MTIHGTANLDFELDQGVRLSMTTANQL